MAAASTGERDIVEFPPNIPVRIPGLKYRNGKIINTRGGDRMMYSLGDGRVCFLDLDTGAKINLLDLQPRESFWVRKTCGAHKGDLVKWEVWKDGPGERYVPAPNPSDDLPPDWPPEPPSEMEVQLRDSIHQVQARKVQLPAPPPVGSKPEASNATRPRTKLEDALKTVVQACHAAQLYAAEIGFAMPPWSSEDLRTMANTLIIDSQRGAR